MNECVRLAIIPRDKAEALHRVEEFHRAGSLFAGQRPLWRGFALGYGNNFANNHEVAGRNLAATVNQGEFQALTFGQTFQPGAFNRADVDEHVFAAIFALHKAKTLLGVEEFHNALALANDLRGHAAASTAATGAWRTAEAAAITAAKAAATTSSTAEAITATAAKPVTTAAKPVTTAAKPVTTAATTGKGIESFFAEPVALVSAPAATPSVKTHKTERTFASPQANRTGAWTTRTVRHGDQSRISRRPLLCIIRHNPKSTP